MTVSAFCSAPRQRMREHTMPSGFARGWPSVLTCVCEPCVAMQVAAQYHTALPWQGSLVAAKMQSLGNDGAASIIFTQVCTPGRTWPLHRRALHWPRPHPQSPRARGRTACGQRVAGRAAHPRSR